MIFLILSILSSSVIYFLFKIIGNLKINLLHAIIINYFTAAATGFVIGEGPNKFTEIITADWFYISVLLGILFIVLFFIIGLSTRHTGITLTSIGTKMSVVFPMLFSIFYYNEEIFLSKIIGIFLALISIILVSLKGSRGKLSMKVFIYPLSLFIGMGLIDSLVKFNQAEYLQNTGAIESSSIIFSISAIVGILVQISGKNTSLSKMTLKTMLLGIGLGLANFGSLYFMILALNNHFVDSSVIFGMNNLSIIIISTLAGSLIFNEKLSKLNWVGVLLSLLAIILLSVTR